MESWEVFQMVVLLIVGVVLAGLAIAWMLAVLIDALLDLFDYEDDDWDDDYPM